MSSYIWPPNGSNAGTVTTISVATANGFAGTVATASTTPVITLSTTATGVLKGNGTAISAATAGTDYSAGTSALATGILKSTTTTGALTIAVAGDFPVLPYISTTLGASATSGGLTVSGNTLSAAQSSGSVNGWLSSTDWTTFNNKQGTITTGNLTDVGTDGIVVTGGSGSVIGSGTSIAQHVADTTHNGYLSSADWNTFNGKGSGTVTAVSVASANGFAGSSSGGATPALTLSTSITGVLKGNGTAISAATAGTDYSAGTSALGTGILKSTTTTGALTIAIAGDFPTLNQNTTGTAAGLSATLVETSGGTNQSSYTTGDTLYASATNTLSKLTKGTSGQIYTQGASIPSWSNPPIPQFVLGATDSTRRSTANTSFTATAGPTVAITPTYTGTYRVSGIVNLANTTAGKGSYAAIEATVGSPTILLQNVIEYDCPTNGFSTSVPVMSYYTLTAATSYTFAVFIKTDSGGSVSINNDNCPAVLTAQQVG